MKTAPYLILASSLALSATTRSFAASPEDKHPLLPSAPRTIIVLDSDTPPIVRAGLLQSTLIMLPAEEKVATVFGGDTVSWVFDGGHVASRFISVKPKIANSTTDVHIVSDHGNEYTLQLREVSTDGDPHFDSKVFVTPGDQAGKDKLAALPVFVPVAELDKAKQEIASAKARKLRRERPRRPRLSSTAVSTPASSTSTTRGTKRKGTHWDCSRCGGTTSSRTCAATSRKHPRCTS